MTERDPLNIAGKTLAEKYEVERLVGEGGFAVVYKARHAIWEQPVAIKFFNGLSAAPEDQRDELKRAFIQEGALLTELSSQTAGIVQARDVGALTTPGGQWMPYMVLEWLDGASLEELLEQEHVRALAPWSVAEVVGFFSRVLPALDVAHARGIAHRDIKPANLFVLGKDARAVETHIKLLDFGVAKMVGSTQLKAALAKTGVGITSFTPQYGAPEQFTRSYGATGPWTDVYAMALVGVELLTGRAALRGDDLVQLGFATANESERPTPRARGVLVPDAVEAVFAKALAVNPAERFASAAQFCRAARDAIGLASEAGTSIPPAASLTPAPPVPSAGGQAESFRRASTATPAVHSAPEPTGSSFSRVMLTAVLLAAGAYTLHAFRPDLTTPVIASTVSVAHKVGQLLGVQGSQSNDLTPTDESNAASSGQPGPTSTSEPSPSQEQQPPPLQCPSGMVPIPGGEFTAGSSEGIASDDEKPAHVVTLAPYCIDRHEVTAADYLECYTSKKCKRPSKKPYWPDITATEAKAHAPLCTFQHPKYENHPINCVTWTLADAYCKARNKRLPTEAEWEFAARGPTPRIYPWGDEEPTQAHLNGCDQQCSSWRKSVGLPGTTLHTGDDGFAHSATVGSYVRGASAFGVLDMAGNVREWVDDWFGPYPAEPTSDPKGPATGERKVLRGGGWDVSYANRLRTSFRSSEVANARSSLIGFRCAMSEPATAERDAASDEASNGDQPQPSDP